ncbi:MAG: hypothetical protein KKD69_09235 [Euryarchaeota archaeon]|nr:hypothetical protein [Euryarchaeota archaeon]MCG2727218.1 hypothetical protein [Candidatus Methanoperedenaceae archaeon]
MSSNLGGQLLYMSQDVRPRFRARFGKAESLRGRRATKHGEVGRHCEPRRVAAFGSSRV